MYPFEYRSAPFEWVKKLAAEDRAWARAYLSSHMVMVFPNTFEPHNSSPASPDDFYHREKDQALRNAWRQRKARKKTSTKKAYNFVLSISSKRKLDKIASDMHSTLVDALELIINEEAKRAEEHREMLKLKRQEILQIKRTHEEKLSEARNANNYVLSGVEIALQIQTMKLVTAELRLERPMLQHVALSELKEDCFKRFEDVWPQVRKNLGPSALALIIRFPDTEYLWSQVIAGDSRSDASSDISNS
jgi:hypothetical protein